MADTPVIGQQQLASANGEFNTLTFLIQQMMSRLNVATLAKVVAVYPGGTGVVGTVDILPLVNQVAGDGTLIPHTTIFNVPYFRLQGGSNAVIVDPGISDIGFVVFADRDFSTVQDTHAQAAPGSARRFDMADALYIGGWCANQTPINFVQINNSAINVTASSASTVTVSVGGSTSFIMTNGNVVINAEVQINGNVAISKNLTVTGNITGQQNLIVAANFTFGGSFTGTGLAGGGNATLSGSLTATGNLTASGDVIGGSIHLTTHTHTGVTSGGSNTGGPV